MKKRLLSTVTLFLTLLSLIAMGVPHTYASESAHYDECIDLAALESLLQAHEIDINALNNDGNALIHVAIDLNDLDLAAFLLDHGADFQLKNADGQTPVMLADYYNSIDPTYSPNMAELLRSKISEKRVQSNYAKQFRCRTDILPRPQIRTLMH